VGAGGASSSGSRRQKSAKGLGFGSNLPNMEPEVFSYVLSGGSVIAGKRML